MKLEKLLGKELYGQVKAKIDEVNEKEADKLKHIRYADLSEGKYVSKGKFDTISNEKKNLETQIFVLNKMFKELKNSNKDLQNTINLLDTDIKKLQKEYVNIIKTYKLKEQLQKAGVLDQDYFIYKIGGIDKFNFDSENKSVGIDDIIKFYKEDSVMSHLFNQEEKNRSIILMMVVQ